MTSLLSFLHQYRKVVVAAAILKWMALHIWLINQWYGYDFQLALWDSLVTNILLGGASYMLIKSLLFWTPQSGKFLFALGLSFASSWGVQWLMNEALHSMGADNPDYIAFLAVASPLRWAVSFLILCGVSVASLFYYQLIEQEDLAQRAAATATMVKEAELQKLQLQLQPHFLFNCLNSINALILVNPEEARTMVHHLSDFLRATVKRADEHWISFRDEWEYLKLYLEIEKVRFGHRLQVETVIDEAGMEWKIPTLLLQPLVENAIKFGLYGTTGGITIWIGAQLEQDELVVRIVNPFDPDSKPQKGSGFGLRGLERRLYLLFARNDLLKTEAKDSLFSVTLNLPRYYDQSAAH